MNDRGFQNGYSPDAVASGATPLTVALRDDRDRWSRDGTDVRVDVDPIDVA